MENWFQMVVTIVCSVIASSGFWSFLQVRREKKDARTKMLIGLGHDRILCLGMRYIERGYITRTEYDNLNNYLYKPYIAMGGNGTAQKIMKEVEELPIHSDNYSR